MLTELLRLSKTCSLSFVWNFKHANFKTYEQELTHYLFQRFGFSISYFLVNTLTPNFVYLFQIYWKILNIKTKLY